MPFGNYTHNSPGAPLMNGTVGALIGVLDYALPNLGWSKVYYDAASHRAVYRSDDLTTTQFYLWLDDSDAQVADVRGYESISSYDEATGVNPFPTFAQNAGFYFRKSNDSKRFLLWALGYEPNYSGGSSIIYFGDFPSRKPGDNYNCIIMAHPSTSTYPWGGNDFTYIKTASSYPAVFVARNAAGDVGAYSQSYAGAGHPDGRNGHLSHGSAGYPDEISGTFSGFSPLYLMEAGAVRGVIPGFWDHVNDSAGTFPDPIEVVGLPGKQLKQHAVRHSNAEGSFVIEITEWTPEDYI